MINAIVHVHLFVNFITLDFSSIFPNPEFWNSFILISICPQNTNFLNQFCFRLQKTSSKGGLYIFFYFKIDKFFSFSKMVHIYKLQKKKSSLHLQGEVRPVLVGRFKKRRNFGNKLVSFLLFLVYTKTKILFCEKQFEIRNAFFQLENFCLHFSMRPLMSKTISAVRGTTNMHVLKIRVRSHSYLKPRTSGFFSLHHQTMKTQAIETPTIY